MWIYALCISCLKTLFLHTYRSTDFEVHRNWLAITHSLPLKEWYVDETSEWTLDYPPLFAWFEWLLSQIAYYFDKEMLVVSNLNYASEMTVLFQRLSVIVTDLVLAYSLKECLREIRRITEVKSRDCASVFLLTFANFGLVLVDHVHFQYNGFLFGILFLSIARLLQRRDVECAFWFSLLLNLKHIYLYLAPAFFVYLLRSYCFSSHSNGSVRWLSFSFRKIFRLALTVISVFSLSFAPFIAMGQLQQVLSRLFPFKRGLCHAFWAPNFWAFYNFADKISNILGRKFGMDINGGVASMTGGLVQEYKHSVLPSISPMNTFAITFASMLPCLLVLWWSPRVASQLIRAASMCAFCSFMFGWHVHEKAILLIVLPLGLLTLFSRKEAKYYIILSTVANFSLFPLVFTSQETVLKVFGFLLHFVYASYFIGDLWCHPSSRKIFIPLLNRFETFYLFGLVPIFVYENFIHDFLGLTSSLPFLPLMIISVYCSFGVIYCWVGLYWNMLRLTFKKSKKPTGSSFKFKHYESVEVEGNIAFKNGKNTKKKK